MKKELPIICLFTFLTLFILSSCSVTPPHYFPGYYLGKSGHRINYKESCLKKSLPETNKKSVSSGSHMKASEIKSEVANDKPYLIASKDNSTIPALLQAPGLKFNSCLNGRQLNHSHAKISKHVKQDTCDMIVLKSGNEIEAVVEEVGETTVRYRKCNNKSGPFYTISKDKVFMIKYANGSKDVFNNDSNKTSESKKDTLDTSHAKTEWLGLAGFIVALMSVPVWLWLAMIVGMAAGIVSIILGGTSINRIGAHPNKYKGIALGIISVIIGMLMLILTVLILMKVI